METAKLTIKDESSSGKTLHETTIQFKTSLVTVKDIIEARVIHEVNAYNSKLSEFFHGLVQPSHAEHTLNGYRMRQRKQVDVEKQIYIALDSFQKNAYFILVDDKQVNSLEQEVNIKPETIVSFVKLTPLVGG